VTPSPIRSTRRVSRLVPIALLLVASCVDAPRSLLSSATAPPDIQKACALANVKCAQCHPIERVLVARGIGERRWQIYVEQMRLKPSSGISQSEGDIIFRCLQFVEQSCIECRQGRS
jgi:hypothetical protein